MPDERKTKYIIAKILNTNRVKTNNNKEKTLETVHIKTASKIIAKEITARKTISSLS